MTNMDRILDALPMTPVDPPPGFDPEGLPYPTHEGVLKLAGFEFRVYVLNTGQRIIDADDFNRFFGVAGQVDEGDQH